MVFVFVVIGVAAVVAKEMERGERKMKEKDIHSRRTLRLLRRGKSLRGIPRAAMQRWSSSGGSRLLDREIVFDEASGSLFAEQGVSQRLEWS